MSSWLKKKLGIVKEKTEQHTPYVKVGCFNGVCPQCGQHIVTDVKENVMTKSKSAICGVCESEIFLYLAGMGYTLTPAGHMEKASEKN